MKGILLLSRRTLYCIFIVCNAVVCGTSIWNLLVAKSINHNLQTDVFLVFLGGFALAFIVPLICLELLYKPTTLSRIWFELLWVGIFFALEFSASVALSALVPSLGCYPGAPVIAIANEDCSSTQVLLAFLWIATIFLLGYFLLLLIPTTNLARVDPRIWQRTVNTYPGASETGQMHLTSNPATPEPMLQRFGSLLVRRQSQSYPTPTPGQYSWRAGLDPQYQIEHFQFPAPAKRSSILPPGAAPSAFNTYPYRTNTAATAPFHTLRSSATHEPSTTLPTSQTVQAPAEAHHRSATRPDPPPLHIPEWSQPLRVVKSAHPTGSQSMSVDVVRSPITPAVRSKPSGPRSRSNSSTGDWVRPPALNLANISSLESFKERDTIVEVV